MTAEGAFPLGAAVVVSQIQAGEKPLDCDFDGLPGRNGSRFGFRILHTKMKIPALLTRDCHFDRSLLYQY